MKKYLLASSIITTFVIALIMQTGCTQNPAAPIVMNHNQMIEHGKYLVTLSGCNDCHSPKIMTANGPVLDTNNLLSGSPQGMHLAFIDTNAIAPGKWNLGSPDLTAWVGPWGISYAANLTPDTATGIGIWTEDMFIKVIRSGKFMGIASGRPIMPPMPWQEISKMTDEDMKCMFAYLRSVKPVHNRVHDYVPPPGIMAVNTMK